MSNSYNKKTWRGLDDVYNSRFRTNSSYMGWYSSFTKKLAHKEMRADTRSIKDEYKR